MFVKSDNNYQFVNSDKVTTHIELEAGVYKLRIHRSFSGMNWTLEPDNTYIKGQDIKSATFQEVKQHVDDFFSPVMQEVRDIMGDKNKLGLLFKGIPGTGKTFTAGQLGQKYAEEQNAICIISNECDLPFNNIINDIRKYGKDPNRKVVLILDEFDKDYTKQSESKILSFLDGMDSPEHILVIATANKTNSLPNTLTSRPGRFEKIYTFDIQTSGAMEGIIYDMIPEKYREKIDQQQITDVCTEKGVKTIDEVRIIVRDKLYEILKEIKNKEAEEKKENTA